MRLCVELPARGCNVASPALANGSSQITSMQNGLKGLQRAARTCLKARAWKRVEADQIHFGPNRRQQLDQAARVGGRVVHSREHHVLEGDSAAAPKRQPRASLEQVLKRIALVNRRQAIADLV